MNIALIAHDRMKPLIVEIAREFAPTLRLHRLMATGGVDAVVFLRDPMTPQPHEPDINALVRACDVHDVPCATNRASDHILLQNLRDGNAAVPAG